MTKIWLDTINVDVVDEAFKKGLCSGVTTNPAILSPSENIKKTLKDLLSFQEGPVAVQVTSNNAAQMIEEGKKIHRFSCRLIVKIPVCEEGLIAIAELSKKKIPVMATGILTPLQALLAINAGASYLAPYFSHMEKESFEQLITLSMDKIQIVVASIKQLPHVLDIALRNVAFVTIKDDLYKQLAANHEGSELLTAKLNQAWQESHKTSIAALL